MGSRNPCWHRAVLIFAVGYHGASRPATCSDWPDPLSGQTQVTDCERTTRTVPTMSARSISITRLADRDNQSRLHLPAIPELDESRAFERRMILLESVNTDRRLVVLDSSIRKTEMQRQHQKSKQSDSALAEFRGLKRPFPVKVAFSPNTTFPTPSA